MCYLVKPMASTTGLQPLVSPLPGDNRQHVHHAQRSVPQVTHRAVFQSHAPYLEYVALDLVLWAQVGERERIQVAEEALACRRAVVAKLEAQANCQAQQQRAFARVCSHLAVLPLSSCCSFAQFSAMSLVQGRLQGAFPTLLCCYRLLSALLRFLY